MLDLRGDVCYNTITSERFFFFAQEPVERLKRRNVLSVCVSAGSTVFFSDRGRRLLLRRRFFGVEVKAKNISVKREVPL